MIGIILNPRAGYVMRHGVDNVQEMMSAILPDARIHVLREKDDIAACCRDFIAAGATCIAAAGGDGTVNAVASQLAGTETPLGVIPAGTLNHFARDAGIGRNIVSALQTLAAGHSVAMDVAKVNDRLFLNNSSIGIYAHMVALRRRHEKRLGKWRALAHAAWLAARHNVPVDVGIAIDGGREQVHTHMIFVGNNQYETDLLHLGQRSSLQAGQLYCVILEGLARYALLPYVFHYLRDHHPNHRMLRILAAREVIVVPKGRRRLAVSCDGEVFMLTTPLVYHIVPRALRVIVPPPAS